MARQELNDVGGLIGCGSELAGRFSSKLEWLRNMPFWAVSALLHLVLITFFIGAILKEEPRREPAGTISIDLPVPPPLRTKPPPYDPTRKRAIRPSPKLPGPPKASEHPAVPLDVKDPAIEMPPKGDSLDRLGTKRLESSLLQEIAGLNDTFGLGSGPMGPHGVPWGQGPPGGSGNPVGEDVIRAALEWLRRHQSPDGSWKSHDFTKECRKTCQNLDPARHGDGRGFKEHDVGVTGLAMLAFQGFGHTHRDGVYEEYTACLRKAVSYLKQAQVRSEDPATNGRYGSAEGDQWIYDHAIATMAMCEILVMSNDVIGLKRSVTDAVKLCLKAQNDGRGWRYGIKPGDNDTSVTGWMVLALRTAKNARLEIPREEFDRAFAGARNWFEHATSASGRTGYQGPGDAGSTLQANQEETSGLYPYSKELPCMTAVGVLCRIFSGEKKTTHPVREGVKILMQQTPRWQVEKGHALSTINFYYWYYGSYALFQYGGIEWEKWSADMQRALIQTQRQDPKRQTLIDEDGSWDPIDEWGAAGGRVYSTALGALTLEVYRRHQRAQLGVFTSASPQAGRKKDEARNHEK